VEEREMNRKKRMVLFVVLVILTGSISAGILSQAKEGMASKGSLIAEDNDLAAYAQDIAYLQEEITGLLRECEYPKIREGEVAEQEGEFANEDEE
jgi:hypothetical protein